MAYLQFTDTQLNLTLIQQWLERQPEGFILTTDTLKQCILELTGNAVAFVWGLYIDTVPDELTGKKVRRSYVKGNLTAWCCYECCSDCYIFADPQTDQFISLLRQTINNERLSPAVAMPELLQLIERAKEVYYRHWVDIDIYTCGYRNRLQVLTRAGIVFHHLQEEPPGLAAQPAGEAVWVELQFDTTRPLTQEQQQALEGNEWVVGAFLNVRVSPYDDHPTR